MLVANLNHPATRRLVRRWRDGVAQLAARRSRIWLSDQRQLHWLLRRALAAPPSSQEHRDAVSVRVFRGADRARFNYRGGPLVTHHTREAGGAGGRATSAKWEGGADEEARRVARLVSEAGGVASATA